MSHQNPRLNPRRRRPPMRPSSRTRPILSRRRRSRRFRPSGAAARVALSPLRLRAVPAGSSFTGFGIFGQGLLDQGPGVRHGGRIQARQRLRPRWTWARNSTGKLRQLPPATVWVSPVPILPWSVPSGSRSKERLAAIMLAGVSGPITVKGAPYSTQGHARLGGSFHR